MERVDFLDSTGLGVLVGGLKRVRAHDGTLRLVCTQERILKIFRITGLTKVFPIHASVDEAVSSRRLTPIAGDPTRRKVDVATVELRFSAAAGARPDRPAGRRGRGPAQRGRRGGARRGPAGRRRGLLPGRRPAPAALPGPAGDWSTLVDDGERVPGRGRPTRRRRDAGDGDRASADLTTSADRGADRRRGARRRRARPARRPGRRRRGRAGRRRRRHGVRPDVLAASA